MPLPASAAALADRRAAFLQRLDAYSAAQRAFRPTPDAWSPEDVAEHVYRVERAYQTLLRRALAAGDARPDLGAVDPATLARFEAAVDTGERRLRMPTASERFITPQGAPYAQTRAEWAETAARWDTLDAPPALAGVGLADHPLIGPMDADGTLRLLAAHTRHHLFQLDRVEASEGFPGVDV